MRLNFRKVASVLASALMLGSTAGFAAAAWPAPLVTDAGVADAVVVVGANAAASDTTVANSIADKLNEYVDTTVKTGTGESYKIEKSSDKLNIGDSFVSVKTTAITDDDLPTLLADGTYRNDDNEEFDYEQKITLGSDLVIEQFSDKDYKDEEPTLGVHLDDGASVLNYTLTFNTAAESSVDTNGYLDDFDGTEIEILGKTYTIFHATNGTNIKLTLMGGALTDTINLNEEKTYTLNGKTYTVKLVFVDDDEAKFEVNGETTNSLVEGGTYKLSDGTQIGVKDIMYNAVAGLTQAVEFMLGADKIVLQNGQNIELNDETVNELKTYISASYGSSTTSINSITIEWKTDDEEFLTPEQELVMPVFDTVKLTMDDFTFPAEETIEVKNSGNDVIELVVPIKSGTATIPLLKGNGTIFQYIGKDSNRRLVTSTGNSLVFDEDTDDYFVASWASSTEAESYLLSADVYQSDNINYTRIKNEVTGQYVCEDKRVSSTCTIGNVELTINSINVNEGTVNMSINSGGSFQILYSAEGMKIWLPYNSTSSGIGYINLSNNPTSYTLVMKEENKDGDLGAGNWINLTISWTSNKVTVSDIASDAWAAEDSGIEYYEIDDTDTFVGYVNSSLATKVTYDTGGDQDTVELVYHGSESYANVYLAEVTEGEESVATVKVVTDTELTADDKAKNIVAVGGSCVNQVTAELLGVEYPTCGDAWEQATGVGAGKYLYKVLESPYADGKIAVIVAGYEASDTENAGAKFNEGELSLEVGTEQILPQASA